MDKINILRPQIALDMVHMMEKNSSTYLDHHLDPTTEWSIEAIRKKLVPFHFVWPDVIVKPFRSPVGKMDGLFATRRIPKSTFIPYFGYTLKLNGSVPRCFYSSLVYGNEHAYMLSVGKKGDDIEVVNGSPSIDPWVDTRTGSKIGLKGLAVAAKINEPFGDDFANCAFIDSFLLPDIPLLLTLRDIDQGEQLTVFYGTDYVRSREHTHALSTRYKPDMGLRENKQIHDFLNDKKHIRKAKKWMKTSAQKYLDFTHDFCGQPALEPDSATLMEILGM